MSACSLALVFAPSVIQYKHVSETISSGVRSQKRSSRSKSAAGVLLDSRYQDVFTSLAPAS